MATETNDPVPNLVQFWTWRDNVHQRLVSTLQEDAEHAAQFVSRAQELAAEIETLVQNGLNEGAEEALGALAEQDMSDFCIMVDLSQDVHIDDVPRLDPEARLHLEEFLDEEPWHSLMVDTDLTVTLAMLEDLALREDNLPWYRVSPNLARILARVLDQANTEQVMRFAGEIEAMQTQKNVKLPDDVGELLDYVVDNAAKRLGIVKPKVG